MSKRSSALRALLFEMFFLKKKVLGCSLLTSLAFLLLDEEKFCDIMHRGKLSYIWEEYLPKVSF